MTFKQTAEAMRRIADCIDQVVGHLGKDAETGRPKPIFGPEAAVGAALLLVYLRDLITVGGREIYDRGALLVLLETISRDPEIFPCGIAAIMWQIDDDAEAPVKGCTWI